jgi:methyl coenzyme M reductase subunit D
MSKKEVKNEVVLANSFSVSNEMAAEFQGLGMGAGDNVDAQDIIIPKIQLAQQLSQAVKDGEAKAGDFINSLDKTVLASKGESIEMVVMQSYKVWRVFEIMKGKKEYVETIDYIGNENLPIDEEVDGKLIHRDRVQAFYVLLINEIKEGLAFPYIVDFTRSSARAGKQLQTYFAKMRSVGIPSFGKVFSLTSKYVQDDHDYYVKEISLGRNITSEELTAVKVWLDNIAKNKGKMREDDSDLREENSKTYNADFSADIPF